MVIVRRPSIRFVHELSDKSFFKMRGGTVIEGRCVSATAFLIPKDSRISHLFLPIIEVTGLFQISWRLDIRKDIKTFPKVLGRWVTWK